MKINKFFLLAFCAIAIVACKRKGTVNAKVTNVFDNKPIEGIKVRISASSEAALSSNGSGAYQIGTTDMNGNCKINAEYSTKITYDYFISLYPNDNYVAENPYRVKDTVAAVSQSYLYYTSHYKSLMADIKDVKKSKDAQNFEFNIAPCGRLKIVARNAAPAEETDKIEVSVVDKNLQNGELSVYSRSGKNTTPAGDYMMVPTSGTVSLKWKVTTGGKDVLFFDTIPVAPHVKNSYSIFY